MRKTFIGAILICVFLISSTFAFCAEKPDTDNKLNQAKLVTRAEFVDMLHKALDIHIMYFQAPDITYYFDDVSNDVKYLYALYDLLNLKIVDYKGRSFRPYEPIVKQEMVHYIVNAYKFKLGNNYVPVEVNKEPFKDTFKVCPRYINGVAIAAHYGLINSDSDNLFHPMRGVTYKEAALIISRLMNLINNQNPLVSIVPKLITKDDSLEMQLTIINDSKDDIIINHTSGQKYDFVLRDLRRKEIYKWSNDKLFTMALTNTIIKANDKVLYSAVLNEDQYKSIKDNIAELKAYIKGSSTSFYVNSDGYTASITPTNLPVVPYQ